MSIIVKDRRVRASASLFKTHSLVGRFSGNFELDPTDDVADVDELTDEDVIIELVVAVLLVVLLLVVVELVLLECCGWVVVLVVVLVVLEV